MQENLESRINGELDRIRARVDSMREESKRFVEAENSKFDQYLDTLEKKTEVVESRLKELRDDSHRELDRIERTLDEARDRLAIARRAAKAKFDA